jgi:hypothetical protein
MQNELVPQNVQPCFPEVTPTSTKPVQHFLRCACCPLSYKTTELVSAAFETANAVIQAYTCPEYFKDDWLNAYYLYLRHSASPRCHDVPQDASLSTAPTSGIGYPEAPTDVAGSADYRFVYVGLPGSRTLLHADVLHSFSWSINVVGTKRFCTLFWITLWRCCVCRGAILVLVWLPLERIILRNHALSRFLLVSVQSSLQAPCSGAT